MTGWTLELIGYRGVEFVEDFPGEPPREFQKPIPRNPVDLEVVGPVAQQPCVQRERYRLVRRDEDLGLAVYQQAGFRGLTLR